MSERPNWMQDDSLWQSVFGAVPQPIFVVDDDVRLMAFNPAAQGMVGQAFETVLRRRGGEVFHCVHNTDSPQGCGHGPSCGDCVIRNSVQSAIAGQTVTRQRTVMEMVRGKAVHPVELLITASPFQHDGQKLALLILEDITELTTLRRLLPICASCKRVRDDRDYWQTVEKFFTANLNVDFTHGICPECARKLYPDLCSEMYKDGK
jgi:PAS domain-containing protein